MAGLIITNLNGGDVALTLVADIAWSRILKLRAEHESAADFCTAVDKLTDGWLEASNDAAILWHGSAQRGVIERTPALKGANITAVLYVDHYG